MLKIKIIDPIDIGACFREMNYWKELQGKFDSLIGQGVPDRSALEQIGAPGNTVLAKVGEGFLLGYQHKTVSNGPLFLEGKYPREFFMDTSWPTVSLYLDTIMPPVMIHLAEKSWYPPIWDSQIHEFWYFYLWAKYTDTIDEYFKNYYLKSIDAKMTAIEGTFGELSQISRELRVSFRKKLFYAATSLAFVAEDHLCQHQYGKPIFHSRESLVKKCEQVCYPSIWHIVFEVILRRNGRADVPIFTGSSKTESSLKPEIIHRHQIIHGMRTSCDLTAAVKAFSFLWFCFELTQCVRTKA